MPKKNVSPLMRLSHLPLTLLAVAMTGYGLTTALVGSWLSNQAMRGLITAGVYSIRLAAFDRTAGLIAGILFIVLFILCAVYSAGIVRVAFSIGALASFAPMLAGRADHLLFDVIRLPTMSAGSVVVPVTVALMLNNVSSRLFKRTVQTVIYLPHFLSWIIIAGIMVEILSPSGGIVNQALGLVGIKPIFFLGDDRIFPYTMVVTDVWMSFGFGTIIYLAALTDIDPTLYEAAVVDGATRGQQTWYITLPGISGTIIMLSTLSLSNILNAGFDQIFNLYSPLVYRTGDIIDTLVYRTGILNNQYGVATAVGLLKSVVSLLLIAIAYKLADKWAGFRIF